MKKWPSSRTWGANSFTESPLESVNTPDQCCCAQFPDAATHITPASVARATMSSTGPVPSPGPLWMNPSENETMSMCWAITQSTAAESSVTVPKFSR